MTPIFARARHRAAVTALSILLSGTAVTAQEAAVIAQPATLLQPSDYAPAVIRQDTGNGIYELLAAPELGLVFLASSPGDGENLPGFVHSFGIEDLHPVRAIQLPRQAFALAMDYSKGLLYVGNTVDGSLSVVDARSGLLTNTIQLGQKVKYTNDEGKEEEMTEHTRKVVIDEDASRIYVSSPSDKGTVWIVDSANGTLLKRVDDAQPWATGLDHDPEAGLIYVGGSGINEFTVLNDETGEKVRSFSTGDTTSTVEEESKHFFVNLKLDTAGNRLFATDSTTGNLYVINTEDDSVIATVPIGTAALDVEFNPERNEIYVTYRGVTRQQADATGGLVVVDGSDYSVRQNLSVPVIPQTVKLSPDNQTLLLSVKTPYDNKNSNFRVGMLSSILKFDLARLAEID